LTPLRGATTFAGGNNAGACRVDLVIGRVRTLATGERLHGTGRLNRIDL